MHRQARYYCVNTEASELHGSEYGGDSTKVVGSDQDRGPRLMLLFHSGACFQYLYCFSNVREQIKNWNQILFHLDWCHFAHKHRFQDIVEALPQAKKAVSPSLLSYSHSCLNAVFEPHLDESLIHTTKVSQMATAMS